MNMKINPFMPNMELTRQGPIAPLKKADTEMDFQDVLKGAIKDVNSMQQGADQKIGALLKGESQDLHQTIMAVQQADSSFRMMMQVRNKIVEAYKEISRSGM